MTARLSAVVLAAGEGTRMRSTRPKPLHRLCGRPMVLHVLDALAGLSGCGLALDRVVVVVGHGGARVQKTVQGEAPAGLAIDFVEQPSQRGTGDAVSVALTELPDTGHEQTDLLVLPADTPLLRPASLAALTEVHRVASAAATVLTARMGDPTGYGRVIRARDGGVARVVEQADASEEERLVDEVNTSIYCFRHPLLAPALRRLSPVNAQGEYYLTDVLGVLHDAGHPVVSMLVDDPSEVAGINDRAQLAQAEAELRARTNRSWMARGVTMPDPSRTYVDASVVLAGDVTLWPGTMLSGATVVGPGAEIGPETRLHDTRVGEGAVVVRTEGRLAEIGAGATVGPFAVLEPGGRVAPGTATGPFFRVGGDDESRPGGERS
ncbi:MAG: bifunctional UDP-N-acetylglucosamine diphosphorylase/glucosamine-1-phosphate N-acetyltransferase GlmU [Acidimicrobiales bacterium]